MTAFRIMPKGCYLAVREGSRVTAMFASFEGAIRNISDKEVHRLNQADPRGWIYFSKKGRQRKFERL